MFERILPIWIGESDKDQDYCSENKESIILLNFLNDFDKNLELCENIRSVVSEEFLEAMASNQTKRVLVECRRRETLLRPEDLPPTTSRGDEEYGPVKSVLLRILGPLRKCTEVDKEKSSDGSSNKRIPRTQRINESNELKLQSWFDVGDICKYSNYLQAYYKPEDLSILESLTLTQEDENGGFATNNGNNYLFIDSLDELEIIIDFQFAKNRNQNEYCESTVLIEPSDWLSPTRQAPIITLSSNQPNQSVKWKVPPGRQCFRIFAETSLALCLNFVIPLADRERTTFILGPMESCVQEAIKEPKLEVQKGENFFDKFQEVIQYYSSKFKVENWLHGEFRKFFTDQFPGSSSRKVNMTIQDIFPKFLSKTSEKIDQSDVLDLSLAWKILSGDPNANLNLSNLRTNSAKKTLEHIPETNELTLRGIVQFQALFRGYIVRRIMKAFSASSHSEDSFIERIRHGLDIFKEILETLKQCDKINLYHSLRKELGIGEESAHFTLFSTSGALKDLIYNSSGFLPTVPSKFVENLPKKQYITTLFHQPIRVLHEKARMRLEFQSDEETFDILVMDTQSGGIIYPVKDTFFSLDGNGREYCLIGHVYPVEKINSSSTWQFQCLTEGYNAIEFDELKSKFSTWDAAGILQQDENGLILRLILEVPIRQIISFCLKLENISAPVKLVLFTNEEGEIPTYSYKEEGGIFTIPAHFIKPQNLDLEDDDTNIGGQNREQREIHEIETSSLILEAYMKKDEVKLSSEEIEFISGMRKTGIEELEELPKVPKRPESRKSSSGKRSPLKAKPVQESNLPGWNLQICYECSPGNSITLKHYGPRAEELGAIKASWFGNDKNRHLEAAKEIRRAYLLSKSKTEEDGGSESMKNHNFSCGQVPVIPPIDQEEFEQFFRLLRGTTSDEIAFNHHDEVNIHHMCRDFVNLAIPFFQQREIHS